MVSLILKYLNKIKHFFLIIPILIGIMVFVGLFFANQKSKPEFSSKPERIMFETKNKSPKYIITLPEDKKKEQLKKKEEDSDDTDQASSAVPEQEKTNAEKLSALDIPFIARVRPNNTKRSLPHLKPLTTFLSDGLPVKNDNLEPWAVYGEKVSVLPMFSKVSVVIKNMGGNYQNAMMIIERLPEEVSLSFSPYASSLENLVSLARKNGHETYLDLLLPSRNFATTDSGPLALDFEQTPQKNIEKLEKMLSGDILVGGYVFVDGIDDADYKTQFLEIMKMLEARGLLMLDATHGKNVDNINISGLDRVHADIVIDNNFDREEIENKLKKAEEIALKNGSVVVVIDPKPVAVLAVSEWLETFSKQLNYEEIKAQGIVDFEKPLALVPLSNMVGEY